jgi:hypothetical protein
MGTMFTDHTLSKHLPRVCVCYWLVIDFITTKVSRSALKRMVATLRQKKIIL